MADFRVVLDDHGGSLCLNMDHIHKIEVKTHYDVKDARLVFYKWDQDTDYEFEASFSSELRAKQALNSLLTTSKIQVRAGGTKKS